MNRIPPLDLARQYRQIDAEASAAALEVLRSGRYIGGAAVSDFEQAFARHVGTAHCVACNSGTDALYLALRALDIGPGDEVIVPPFTFIATAEVVSEVGAKPVFADIELATFNLDLAQVERAITPRTKAIIPVHLFGRPLDMAALQELAAAHNVAMIEDCAQATGAKWGDRRVGSFGQVGCFSFFPTKNLGACGDGGAMTTDDAELAAKLRMLREHGQKERYRHDVVGVNSRLDTLQAVLLSVKLRYLDPWNEQRDRAAQRYRELLAPLPKIALPTSPAGGQAVWNQYTIRLVEATSEQRDRLRADLQAQGVSSAVYYPLPLHLQPVYQNLNYPAGSLPAAERACQEVLSLPMFPELQPEEQEQVAYALKDCL
ncbi:MAG: DegT/DnrJ/EryC1/StrS family aminotransferase [Spirulinaceae cyanobacterium SM2_1_0]|nr:DegT/DnrJ/EryC1/StrS family aminotransferase [Spirulinaceae cyanobacterium SM2_1_0]